MKVFVLLLLVFAAAASVLAWPPRASVSLAWSDADPTVTGYDVYYGTLSGTYTSVVDVGDSTNATIGRLLEGTTYYFAVTAYNSNGVQSAYSPELAYTVPPPPLPPPPVFTFYTADGAFALTLENPGGALYGVVRSNGDVQFSEDCSNWFTLENLGAWRPLLIKEER